MPRKLAPCGTRSAYNRHLRRGEQPCEPCREASRANGRNNYTRYDLKKRSRAHQRAFRRLAQLHRDEFAELYAEELERVAGEPE